MDIGYSFLEEYEGRGYAYEAAIKVKEIGMKDFGLKNFLPSLPKKTLHHKKLLGKLGLTYVKDVSLPNDNEVLMYFETE